MKHLFITLFLFLLISVGKISAQSFDVKFSGVETNIVAGTETYAPENQSVFSQLVANRFYSFSNMLDSYSYNQRLVMYGTDFANSPNMNYLEGDTYDQAFSAITKDSNGNVYAVAKFAGYNTIFGESFSPSTSYGNAILKFDSQGVFQDLKFLDTDITIEAIGIEKDTIYYSYNYEGSGYIAKTTIEDASSIEVFDIIPSASINKIIIKGTDLYFGATHTNSVEYSFGATTIPVVQLSGQNTLIGHYDIGLGTAMRINALNFTSSDYNYNGFGDFYITDTKDIYVCGAFNSDVYINSAVITNSGLDSQFLFAGDSDFNTKWFSFVESNYLNTSKIAYANHSVFLSSSFYNYQSDGHFYLQLGDKLYDNVPLEQAGIYVAQFDKKSGEIINSEVFNSYQNGYDFNLYNIECDTLNDSLIVILNSYHSSINCSNGSSYNDMSNGDFVKISIGNIKPQFHFKEIVNGNITPYIKCREEAFGVNVDLSTKIYHPDYTYNDLVFDWQARDGITCSINSGILTVDSYTKGVSGLDTIYVTATDPLNDTVEGYIYLYEFETPTVTWDTLMARRCIGSSPTSAPDFVTYELKLPTNFANEIDNNNLFNDGGYYLNDGSNVHDWYNSEISSGEYALENYYGVTLSWGNDESYSCYNIATNPGYRVNDAPTLQFVLPDTVCSSIWLEDSVNIHGGTFSQETTGWTQLNITPYSPYTSYYENLTTEFSSRFLYEVTDIITGCFVTDTTDTVYVKSSVQSLDGYGVSNYFSICDNIGGLTITPQYLLSDSVTWYRQPYRKDSINSGVNFTIPDTKAGNYNYYVTQTLSGCESVPFYIQVQINPSPRITFVGDSVLCSNENLAYIELAPDTVISSYNLYYDWDYGAGNGGPAMAKSFSDAIDLPSQSSYYDTYAYLTEGIHNLYIEDYNTYCYSEKQIEISTKIVPAPNVADTTISYGKAAPILYVEGDSIRWYSATEILLANSNELKTGIKASGVHTLLVTETDGRCESDYDTVKVTILPCPAVAPSFVDDTLSYCVNEGTYILDADNSSVRWFEDATKMNQVENSDSISFTNLTAGFYTYYAADFDSVLTCFSTTTPVTLHVLPKPIVNANYPTFSNEDSDINLMEYVLPKGGLFENAFVSDDSLFNANLANMGIHSIKYTFIDGNGCFDSIVRNVSVVAGSIVVQQVKAGVDTVRLTINESVQLSASVIPANATYKTVNWSVDNSSIAQIDATGLLIAVSLDTTFVVVNSTVDITKTDTVIVIVESPSVVSISNFAPICLHANSIKLTGALPIGGTYFGSNVSKGYFTPNLTGLQTIGYAYQDNFGNADTAYASIDVIEPNLPVTSNVNAIEYSIIPNLTASGDSIEWYESLISEDYIATGNTFEHGKTAQGLYAYYVVNVANGCSSEPVKVTLKIDACVLSQPVIAARTLVQCENDDSQKGFVAQANNEVQWYNSDDELVETGLEFTPQVATFGDYEYYAKQFNGSCYSSPISVLYTFAKNPKVEITAPDSIVIGKSFSASIAVTDATLFQSKWMVNNSQYIGNNFNHIFETENVYSISNIVTNSQSGCKTESSKSIKAYKIHVPVESISITEDTIEIFEGYSKNLSAIVLPEYATNKNVIWKSGNESIVTMNDSKIYGVASGETWVYAIAEDNLLQDSAYIQVKKFVPVADLSLPRVITIYVEDTMNVVASIIPSYASFPHYKFLQKEDGIISMTESGRLIGVQKGMSTIIAISDDGKQYASSIIFVSDELVNPTELQLAQAIHTVAGTQSTISLEILPEFSSTSNLLWTSVDSSIVIASAPGIVTSFKKGITTIYVTDTVTNITTSAIVRVTNSLSPEFYPLPTLQMNQTADSVVLDLSLFAKDDSTAMNELIWQFAGNDKVTITLNGSIVTIKPAQTSFIGSDTIVFSVTDEEGSVVSSQMVINLIEKSNEAPVISSEVFNIPFIQGYNEFDMRTRVRDDFSDPSEIKWTVENSNRFTVNQIGNYLIITSKDKQWFGVDSITLTATDRHLLSSTATVAVAVLDKPNSAPEISQIPVQYNNDTAFFSYIELNNFVKDDYTSPSNIKWSSSQSDAVSIKFIQNIAFIKIINPFWSGAEVLTFTATDEQGAQSSIDVLFLQEQSRGEGWKGKPTINFIANKQFGVPNDEITLYASLSGATSWKWSVEGIELQDSSKVIQTISFPNPGIYTVSLWAINPDGVQTLVKNDYLTIYGVADRTPAICIGDSYTLTVNDATLDSYEWSTGETGPTIVVNPDKTTEYTVTIKDGLFTFVDKITVRVSVPVNLGLDSAICAGTVYNLDAGVFESYIWNTQATTRSIQVSAVGDYTVTTIDDIGCESSDTYRVTKLNPLPHLDLGEDKTVCDGEIITLDAGIGYTYNWTNGYKGEQVVIDSNKTIGVTITDKNQCESSDTITITFKYPFTEQIGVVTFSETNNNIIIAWEKTMDVNTAKYQVYREMVGANAWSLVGEVPFDSITVVEDSLANYVMRQYSYSLVTVDQCGNSSPRSEIHSSMHLQTSWNADNDKKMNLRWAKYEPEELVESYIIYRGPSNTSLVAIDSLPNTKYEWTDSESNVDMVYRVVFRLRDTIDPKKNCLLKTETGPFILALSNIAEAETSIPFKTFEADVVAYPLPFKNVINVLISSLEVSEYTIELISMSGQVLDIIQTDRIQKDIIEIPSEYILPGTYTLRISNEKGVKYLQIVK